MDLLKENYISRRPILDFLRKCSSEIHGKVLDFGCGNMPYKELFTQATGYLGLDYADTAEKMGFSTNKEILYYDGRDIPLEKESVECVLSISSLEYVENLDYSLSEIWRILLPDGVFLASVPMNFPMMENTPFDNWRFTEFGLKRKLEQAGFKDIEIYGTTRAIDTLRRMRINTISLKPMRKIYTFFSNLSFVLYESSLPHAALWRNRLRRMIGKREKDYTHGDKAFYPCDWVVRCQKGSAIEL